MKAIITVVGADRVGIISGVSSILASMDVNIIDLSQTIMSGLFTMTMLTDITGSSRGIDEIRGALTGSAALSGLDIRVQRTDIFDAMHKI